MHQIDGVLCDFPGANLERLELQKFSLKLNHIRQALGDLTTTGVWGSKKSQIVIVLQKILKIFQITYTHTNPAKFQVQIPKIVDVKDRANGIDHFILRLRIYWSILLAWSEVVGCLIGPQSNYHYLDSKDEMLINCEGTFLPRCNNDLTISWWIISSPKTKENPTPHIPHDIPPASSIIARLSFGTPGAKKLRRDSRHLGSLTRWGWS